MNATLSLGAVARDASGAAVAGAAINWSGSNANIATVTASGVVRGVSAGSAIISASSGSATSTFAVTVTPDETPASITLSAPLSLVSGTNAVLGVVVRAVDGHVIAVPSLSLSSSDSAVVRLSSGLMIAGKVGTAVITATSGAATASITLAVSAGAAAKLVVRTQPVGGVVGTPLATQPVVEVTDAAGNVVNGQVPVTARITSGGGTLTGTTTVTSVQGVASFTDLAITGVAGSRVLLFSSVNLQAVSSGFVALVAAATPLLVLDSTSLAFTVPSGRTSPTTTIVIQNGGVPPFTVTIDAPVYDAGQPTGWLLASLVGTPPIVLSLQAVATVLPPGVYTARVAVRAAGASNSPVTVTVTLTVQPSTTFTFGSATEKVRVLDVGGVYAPSLVARDGIGQIIPTGPVTYLTRASSVATVDALGGVTATGEGQTWIVVVGSTTSDSVHVIVPRNSRGPVLRSTAQTFVVAAGVPTFYAGVLDTRATPIGAATVAVGYTTATGVFSSVTWTVPTSTVTPVVNSPLAGVIRVSVASATAVTGQIALLRVRVVAPTAGTNGMLTFTVTDIVAPDGSDLLPLTTSTRIPLIVK